jgi:hypothetical protein
MPSVDAAIESNCLPSKIDSPTPAEVAVGESKALSGDSPTPAEVAVGESKALSGETDCFVLDPISVYRPRGTARGGEYYRLSYKEGGKVRQVHIRGGNIASPIAQAKVPEVRSRSSWRNSPGANSDYVTTALKDCFPICAEQGLFNIKKSCYKSFIQNVC